MGRQFDSLDRIRPMEAQFTYWLTRIGEHFVDVYTFDLGRYLIAAGGITLLLWVFGSWSQARRIQPRRAKRQDYGREVLSSFRTVFFFGLTGLTTLLLIEAAIITVHDGSYSAWLFGAQLIAIILAHDTYFYWMHRLLHHRRLFRATHFHHHKSRTPTPWAAYSFSAWEGVAEAAFMPMFLLTTSLMGIAYIDFAIFIFLAWMILRNVIGHAGVEVHPSGWVDNPWLDWLTTTTHHDLHHSEGRHNFGLYFTWWDRWMETEHPRYKEEFRRIAKPLIDKRRAAEIISVVAMAGFATGSLLAGGLSSMGALAA